MQKENKFFFSFPKRSNFDKVKVTKNLLKWEGNKCICLLEREDFMQ